MKRTGVLAAASAVILVASCGGGKLSTTAACKRTTDEIAQVHVTLQKVLTRTATRSDIAPELQAEASRFHSIAAHSRGAVSQTAANLGTLVSRLRVDLLTDSDTSAEVAGLNSAATTYQRACDS